MSAKGRKKNSQQGEVFKFENPGDTLKGYYLGTQEAEGKYGPCLKHLFKTDSGVKVTFGSKGLNDLLEGEKPGTLAEIVYTHDQQGKDKKKAAMKMFDSTWYDSDVLDSSEVSESVNAANSEDEEDYDDEPADIADEEVPADEVRTAPARSVPRASAPSSAQQRKVQELLAKRRTG